MRTRDIHKEELVKEKAIAMIVEDGLENFSVNKLAKACKISVATLYIYYKDKDDLISRIATEEAESMGNAVLKDFDPNVGFVEGLRQQWKTRSEFMLQNPLRTRLFEQLKSSPYAEQMSASVVESFRQAMGTFMKNAVKNNEIDYLPLEVYWSVAFAPLYNLVRFHIEGKSIGGKPFKLTDEILWQTFDLVVKGLKKS